VQTQFTIQVILPLAVKGTFTYAVPQGLQSAIQFGKRVEVQFGKKRIYAALVVGINEADESAKSPKTILSVLDDAPILNLQNFALWQWMSDYYMCTLGELMLAALPSAFKLSSETILYLNPTFGEDFSVLTDNEYLIAEALVNNEQLTIKEVQLIADKRNVYYLIKSLIEKGAVLATEHLQEKYKPKMATYVSLTDTYKQDENLAELFDSLKRAPKQEELLLMYIQLSNQQTEVAKSFLLKHSGVSDAAFKGLVKKNVFQTIQKPIDRLAMLNPKEHIQFELSDKQQAAITKIKNDWDDKFVTLLHGVTSSGKTQIYIELIQEAIADGGQALFLLPEIALTGQMISRLRKVFGAQVGIYHSKFNPQERVEIWHKTINKKYKVVVGARSALFLPFSQLKLIVVDEEHDTSYKQHEPAPRYNARDAAVWYGNLWGAKVILGSATPSMESYYNAIKGKYQLVHLSQRYGGVQAPAIELVNLKQERGHKRMSGHFTQTLITAIEQAVEQGEQAILFKNRRGYSPYMQCNHCGFIPNCSRCDVSLTYHKFARSLKCHYCGFQIKQQETCLECETSAWLMQGFGTEKIEDELQMLLPDLRIGRLDLETTRSKTGYLKIIQKFEDKELDVLVGTQMVTKGLDFDSVGLVGVLSADQLMFYPDFRAMERAFHLLLQVSGRAGRRKKQGKVLIQTTMPEHPIFGELADENFRPFFYTELKERQEFFYPPYTRMIELTLKHKDSNLINKAAFELASLLRKKLGQQVLGPTVPPVSRIRNYYIRNVLIKFPKTGKSWQKGKNFIQKQIDDLKQKRDFKSVIIHINVDP